MIFDTSVGLQAAVALPDFLSQAHRLVVVQQPAMHLALQHSKAEMPLELRYSKGAMRLGGLRGVLWADSVVEGGLAHPNSRYHKAAVLDPCGLCGSRSWRSQMLP